VASLRPSGNCFSRNETVPPWQLPPRSSDQIARLCTPRRRRTSPPSPCDTPTSYETAGQWAHGDQRLPKVRRTSSRIPHGPTLDVACDCVSVGQRGARTRHYACPNPREPIPHPGITRKTSACIRQVRNHFSIGGRCRIRTCVGIRRRIYSPDTPTPSPAQRRCLQELPHVFRTASRAPSTTVGHNRTREPAKANGGCRWHTAPSDARRLSFPQEAPVRHSIIGRVLRDADRRDPTLVADGRIMCRSTFPLRNSRDVRDHGRQAAPFGTTREGLGGAR
jgi:hypothetical protein